MAKKPLKGSYTRKYVCVYVPYNVMHPKITSKTCLTSNTDHDRYNVKMEHDIINNTVKPVNSLLVRLK